MRRLRSKLRVNWVAVIALLIPISIAVYASTCPSPSSTCPYATSGPDPTACTTCDHAGVHGIWDQRTTFTYVTQPCCDTWSVHCPGWYYRANNKYTNYTLEQHFFYCEPPETYDCGDHQRASGSTTCITERIVDSTAGDCCP